jgi:ribosomal protein L11 methyltransferase
MNTIQFSISANEQMQEVLISQLSDLGADGFEQTEDRLLAYFNEVTLKSYEISQLLKDCEFSMCTIQEQNWNQLWENNFEPVTVDDFCTIRAEFHKKPLVTEHEIIITPKMSFGTGHHATTYLMIRQMKEIDFNNKSVFDFGTGTGILAILGEKLGARKIIAIDTDTWSRENAIENIERNSCRRILVEQTSRIPGEKFDIILANINRNVLLENMSELKKHLADDGILLMSGLLTTDEKIIVESASGYQFLLTEKRERNNWISLLFKHQVK